MRTFLFLLFLLLRQQSNAQSVLFPREPPPFGFPAAAVDSMLHTGQYNAIIYGEFHSPYFTPEFKYQLLRHLNAAHGYRHVFLEVSHAHAWLLNRFLETGDTVLFYPPGVGDASAWLSRPGGYRDLWKNLYAYSLGLPADRRFVIHGTDFERSEETTVLRLLIPDGNRIPESLQPIFRTMALYAADTVRVDFTPEAARRQDEIRKAFRANSADVALLYGQNLPLVEQIISNTTKQQTNWRPRNRTMGTFIRKAVAEEKIDKLVGFFGAGHTDYASPSSVPNTVNSIGVFRGKTLNIVAQGYNLRSFRTGKVEYVSGSRERQEKLAQLHSLWLPDGYRAALLPSAQTGMANLRRHADFVLLAEDR